MRPRIGCRTTSSSGVNSACGVSDSLRGHAHLVLVQEQRSERQEVDELARLELAEHAVEERWHERQDSRAGDCDDDLERRKGLCDQLRSTDRRRTASRTMEKPLMTLTTSAIVCMADTSGSTQTPVATVARDESIGKPLQTLEMARMR